MLKHMTTLGFSLLMMSACTESTDLLPVFDGGGADVPGSDAGPRVDARDSDAGAERDASQPRDVGLMDAGVDAVPPIAMSCDPVPPGACEETALQWYWSGGGCNARRDCLGTGYASLGECRLAYRECGATDICGALPSFVDSCAGFEGYAWDGAACVPGCDYLMTDALIYSTNQECTHFHAGCEGAAGSQCGQVLPLGCTRIGPSPHTLLPLSDHEICAGDEARNDNEYDQQVVFVAPDSATYQIRVQTEDPAPQIGAFVAVTGGVCSTRSQDVPATVACLAYDEALTLPARPVGVDSASDRAHTIRISPSAFPDEYTSIIVCVDRVEE